MALHAKLSSLQILILSLVLLLLQLQLLLLPERLQRAPHAAAELRGC